MRDYFPSSGPVEYTRRFVTAEGATDRRHSGIAFDVVVRAVCANCNNGWMSSLETRAKDVIGPMLSDQRVSLDPSDQALVATWATKTLLMLGCATLDPGDVASPSAYSWFFRHQAPLPGSHAWLCRYGGEGQWPLSCHVHGITLTRDASRPTKASETNGFVAVLAIGPFVVWLFGQELDEGPVTRARSDDGHLLIWPATGSVSWPPGRTLRTEGELEALSRQLPGGVVAPLDELI